MITGTGGISPPRTKRFLAGRPRRGRHFQRKLTGGYWRPPTRHHLIDTSPPPRWTIRGQTLARFRRQRRQRKRANKTVRGATNMLPGTEEPIATRSSTLTPLIQKPVLSPSLETQLVFEPAVIMVKVCSCLLIAVTTKTQQEPLYFTPKTEILQYYRTL